ncbi:hypothetical protein [Methylobacterium radiotolerans]|uniref:hypothetical protein n=1 Tax=Methylobacterium radiotolerans TaxID=31998 RepID=UPI00339AD901
MAGAVTAGWVSRPAPAWASRRGAARPGLYEAAYGRPYGYRYAPAGYGCAYY